MSPARAGESGGPRFEALPLLAGKGLRGGQSEFCDTESGMPCSACRSDCPTGQPRSVQPPSPTLPRKRRRETSGLPQTALPRLRHALQRLSLRLPARPTTLPTAPLPGPPPQAEEGDNRRALKPSPACGGGFGWGRVGVCEAGSGMPRGACSSAYTPGQPRSVPPPPRPSPASGLGGGGRSLRRGKRDALQRFPLRRPARPTTLRTAPSPTLPRKRRREKCWARPVLPRLRHALQRLSLRLPARPTPPQAEEGEERPRRSRRFPGYCMLSRLANSHTAARHSRRSARRTPGRCCRRAGSCSSCRR
jgi:hypothetical protein